MSILRTLGDSKDPFRGWKIYCLVLAAFLALMYAVVFAGAFRPMLLADFAITLVSLAGLYGFAFQKRLGWRAFWRVQCFAFPVWDLLFNFALSPSSREAAVRATSLVLMLLLVPSIGRCGNTRSSPRGFGTFGAHKLPSSLLLDGPSR
jgi:hypothetical protein